MIADTCDILDYERLDPKVLGHGFRLKQGEFLLVRQPFRWLRDSSVIPNAYEMFTMEQVCRDNGFQIVETYGDNIAICK